MHQRKKLNPACISYNIRDKSIPQRLHDKIIYRTATVSFTAAELRDGIQYLNVFNSYAYVWYIPFVTE